MGRYEIKGEGRRSVALLLSLALLQVACYYLAAAWVNGAGSLPCPQPDTLLYCQAARRICEGQAFSFTPGTAVSTGTTSVLYPFVLAVPYALGCKGGALLTAGFLLNALFYLVFVAGWSFAFRRWLSRGVAAFASLLLVLFPQTVYCAVAQSDTGVWMAVSALFAAGLASGRVWLYGPMLALGPWVRPEGVLLMPFFGLAAVVRRRWRDLIVLLLAGCSLAGVFALNRSLTGVFGFSSVAQKGFFTTQPFAQAVLSVSEQLFSMARELFFGQASSLPRGLYSLPLVGSLALIVGAAAFDWKRHWATFGVLAAGALASLGVVAQSGWQGSNCDRYFAWLMPLLVMFAAGGWHFASTSVSARGFARAFLAVPVLYSVGASFFCCVFYHVSCNDTERMSRFAAEIDRNVPDRASVGVAGWCGIAYWLGDRRVANLGGIYSPELSARDVSGTVEILKNEPTTRFDYWLVSPDDAFPSNLKDLMPETALTGPDAFQLKRTQWAAFDRAAELPEVKGCEFKCRVDVGYEKEEKLANFEIVSCYGMRPFRPLIEVADLNGKKAVDCGRLVVGYAEMDVVNLEPGKDVKVVIRVADEVKGVSSDSFGSVFKTGYSFKGRQGLHLSVDGREVACCQAQVCSRGFNDIVLTLPGRYVTASRHRLGIHGDHAAFVYWYYQ